MDNGNKGAENREDFLSELAEAILDGDVFTSRHLWVMAQNDGELYVKMMKDVFGTEFSDIDVKELNDILKTGLDDGVLFYQRIEESAFPISIEFLDPERLPYFKKPLFIYGDDLKKLDRFLLNLHRQRYH